MSDEATKAAGEKSADVTDYLTNANKRKRKPYVICAFGSNIDESTENAIIGHIKAKYLNLIVAHPRSVEEFKKQVVREINLLIVDDEFAGNQEETLGIIKGFKEKKYERMPPTLFLTKQPRGLISQYSKSMLQFHETDDYINYSEVPVTQIFNRIKSTLEGALRRRSRRYKSDLEASIQLLGSTKETPVQLIDFSIHGAQIKSLESTIFRINEQMRLRMHLHEHFLNEDGEFLKLSARVRRVMIGGNIAGVSFEYMSDRQLRLITEFITRVAAAAPMRKATPAR
jgi:hypothetical protein